VGPKRRASSSASADDGTQTENGKTKTKPRPKGRPPAKNKKNAKDAKNAKKSSTTRLLEPESDEEIFADSEEGKPREECITEMPEVRDDEFDEKDEDGDNSDDELGLSVLYMFSCFIQCAMMSLLIVMRYL